VSTILVFLTLLVALTPLLGSYMHRVYTRERIGRAEALVYRLIGVRPTVEQTWRRYASSMLWFSLAGMVFLYLLLRVQGHLDLSPQSLGGVNPFVAFNTAASFVTNTDWQAYGGETTLSYLSQTLGLTTQLFVSAAVGMSALLALIRGFVRTDTDQVGNFWRDMVRSVLYILLPLAGIVALILVAQGAVQNLGPYRPAQGVQGFRQLVSQGPAASFTAISELGTNGGGFFNANSAHPFQNPTPITNLVLTLSIVVIPAALTFTFGKMVGSVRQGWALFAAMLILLLAGLAVTVPVERTASEAMRAVGLPASTPNLEGKEVRFGADGSSLWSMVTTAVANGSVNSMHDSYKPLSGAVQIFNMAVGEVIFGGAGSGLIGMLFYAILAVFIGGLMVGRTPEFLGKKIRAREVKLTIIGLAAPFLLVLGLTAVAVVIPSGLDARLNVGPHGFSEILYAFVSQANNNGSALAGLDGARPFYAVAGGVAMLLGRFVPLLAALALAGSLGGQGKVPVTSGTLRTDTGLFVGFLIAVVLIAGALTFLPALSLGPIVEALSHGRLF
jgi:K+-transporting ATPase ATPase A chain